MAVKHVTVIGAGIIGLTTAWELHKRGVRVTIVDAHSAAKGASAINAGWIVPSMSAPVPAPGVIRQSVKWLLKPDSPLSIRPQFSGDFLRWLLRFSRACSAAHYQRGFEAVAELNRETMQRFDALRDEGIDVEMHEDGVLYAFESIADMEHELRAFEQLRPFGYTSPRPLTGKAVQDREPALSVTVSAAFLAERERSVRPETLLAGLTNRLLHEGVTIRDSTRVTGFDIEQGRLCAVRLGAQRLETDGVVIAAGVWSKEVGRMAGARIPLEPGKGYSLDFAIPPFHARSPVYLHDHRVAVTPFASGVRIAGTMELGQHASTLSQRRVAAIAAAGKQSFQWDASDPPYVASAGMRPMTPDGLPLLGFLPGCRDIVLASGHAMLGVTLAPVTGAVVADLLTQGTTSLPIAPFSPDRFR